MAYFLLSRASELSAYIYADGQVHPEHCLTSNSFTFLPEGMQLAFENRWSASAVQMHFFASESDQKRAGRTISRNRLVNVRETGGASMRAFEALVNYSPYNLSYQGRRR